MILILTGPPAAGKNTIAALLAAKRRRCAVIDVDVVRWMLVQPHRAPWDGEEGRAQQQFGITNACLLAKRFAANSCDVILLDVLTDETAALYDAELALFAPKIALLMPALDEIIRRNKARPILRDDEVLMLYGWQERLTHFDVKLDNTTLSAQEAAEWLNRLFA